MFGSVPGRRSDSNQRTNRASPIARPSDPPAGVRLCLPQFSQQGDESEWIYRFDQMVIKSGFS